MSVYVYPTDRDWFDFLRARAPLDEVNFWRPGGRSNFHGLAVGDLFLFRLHSPVNMIAGGGFFLHSSIYPLQSAWEAFGEKNGTSDRDVYFRKIAQYKRVPLEKLAWDSPIGCIILAEPFFWPREQWIPVPADYHPSLVQGKRYPLDSDTGRSLSDAVAARLARSPGSSAAAVRNAPELHWRHSLVRQRGGQGAFRVLVTDLYERRCAITGERTLPVLEAAHIRPVTRGGTHDPANGLLLRSDIHKLFDLGYVTVQPSGRFRVSARLRDEWSNGKVYYALDTQDVRRPNNPEYAPSRELLEWHGDTVFRG